jgi:hypothetical protein
MVKFISNKKPEVKIGGVGTFTPTIKRLMLNSNKALLIRFKNNKAIYDPGEIKLKKRRRKRLQ